MSGAQDILVATVQMPERGTFLLRADAGIDVSGLPQGAIHAQCVVQLDYDEDVGSVRAIVPYSAERHGDRPPAFRLLRRVTDEDRQVMEENARLAEAMRGMFRDAVRNASDMRIPYARLSFGRKRLFLRYVSEGGKPDISSAMHLIQSRYSVEVAAKPMGARDEVAVLGALGPCGRACCCCTWQGRYPSHIAPGRKGNLAAALNGVCGRFRCCLAFERDDGCHCSEMQSASASSGSEGSDVSEKEKMT